VYTDEAAPLFQIHTPPLPPWRAEVHQLIHTHTHTLPDNDNLGALTGCILHDSRVNRLKRSGTTTGKKNRIVFPLKKCSKTISRKKDL
jgi:hypothetical protein